MLARLPSSLGFPLQFLVSNSACPHYVPCPLQIGTPIELVLQKSAPRYNCLQTQRDDVRYGGGGVQGQEQPYAMIAPHDNAASLAVFYFFMSSSTAERDHSKLPSSKQRGGMLLHCSAYFHTQNDVGLGQEVVVML